jgi:hypothetical protein
MRRLSASSLALACAILPSLAFAPLAGAQTRTARSAAATATPPAADTDTAPAAAEPDQGARLTRAAQRGPDEPGVANRNNAQPGGDPRAEAARSA